MNRQIIWVVLVLASACGPSDETLKKEVLAADRAFSELSKAKGTKEAFIFYAAPEVIKPQPDQQPIIGKDALMNSFEKTPAQDFELTWEPLKAEVSGSLGYTFGNYFLKTKTADMRDTIFYGNYVSIWKKQPNGTWQYVLDTGNPTPGPTKLP